MVKNENSAFLIFYEQLNCAFYTTPAKLVKTDKIYVKEKVTFMHYEVPFLDFS